MRSRIAGRYEQAGDARVNDLGNAAGRRWRRSARPHAIASSSEVPSPSVIELITNRSKLLMHPSTSVRNPGRSTCFSRWCSRICRSSVFAELALAEDDEARIGHGLHHEVRRVDQVALALVRARARRRCRRPARRCGRKNVSCRFTGGAACDVCQVDAFVDRHRLIGRHAVLEQHAADGVGRGDETVDLPVLPARERVRLEVKIHAPRCDDGGRRVPVAVWPWTAQARPPPRRAGSWAWITSGCSRLSSRESRHPADRSISVSGASGMSSRPSAARRRSSPSGCATRAAR